MNQQVKARTKAAAPKPVTFETAMMWLRRGKPIRRLGWHKESLIFRLDNQVFVKLPARAPQVWQPYPQDILATDWSKA